MVLYTCSVLSQLVSPSLAPYYSNLALFDDCFEIPCTHCKRLLDGRLRLFLYKLNSINAKWCFGLKCVLLGISYKMLAGAVLWLFPPSTRTRRAGYVIPHAPAVRQAAGHPHCVLLNLNDHFFFWLPYLGETGLIRSLAISDKRPNFDRFQEIRRL